jgi:hypothetical protein
MILRKIDNINNLLISNKIDSKINKLTYLFICLTNKIKYGQHGPDHLANYYTHIELISINNR